MIGDYQLSEAFTSMQRYAFNSRGLEVDRANVILELTDHAAPLAQMTVRKSPKTVKITLFSIDGRSGI